MRIVGSVVACALFLGGCGQPRTFVCASDGDCVLGTVPGQCERDGFCSFPDVVCASGSRYGEHAPAGVRSACVASETNDACEAAIPLVLGETTAGELRASASSGLLACSPAANADVFYELELADCSDVRVRAEAPAGNLGVALIRDCATELGCADAAQTSMPETVDVYGVPAGTYQVAVAGVGYDRSFSVTADVAPVPGNDTIAGAIPLTSGAPRVDSLARATDNITCGNRVGGRDVVYSVVVSAPSVLEVAVTGHASTDFAVALLDSTGAEIACEDASGGPARFYEVGAGTYLLAVDGPTTGDCGRFDVEMSIYRVPTNNRCITAMPISCPIGPPISIVDLDNQDFLDATNDSIGSCGGSGGDVVYVMPVVVPSDLRIRVTERAGPFTPVVYVRKIDAPAPGLGCGAAVPVDPACASAPELQHRPPNVCSPGRPAIDPVATTELACATDAAVAQLDLFAIQPGWYHVIVDSDGGTTGRFDLTIDRLPPAGDVAFGPELMGCHDEQTGGCCDMESTVNATRDTFSSTCVAARPDVFRTIAVPDNCLITGSWVVVGETPYAAEMTRGGICPGVPVSSCAQDTAAVLGADGQYRTTIPILMSGSANNCVIELRVFAPQDATTRGPIAIHYNSDGPAACQ